MIAHINSIEKEYRRLVKIKKDCDKLGLVEMDLANVKTGMIIYGPKPTWSKQGYGWMYDLSFPKHIRRYRVVSPPKSWVKPAQESSSYKCSIREIGTKKVDCIFSYIKQYVWVLEKSIKK